MCALMGITDRLLYLVDEGADVDYKNEVRFISPVNAMSSVCGSMKFLRVLCMSSQILFNSYLFLDLRFSLYTLSRANHGSDRSRQTQGGDTALICAVNHGAMESTRVLLEAGADVNCRGEVRGLMR